MRRSLASHSGPSLAPRALLAGVALATALAAPTRAFAWDEPPRSANAGAQNSVLEWLQVIGAPTLFMLGYLPALTVGVAGALGPEDTRAYTYSAIPLAGPLVSATSCTTDTCASTGFWTFAVVDTAFQAAGVVMLVLSMAMTPYRDTSSGARTARRRAPATPRPLQWAPTPLSAPGVQGAGVTVAF